MARQLRIEARFLGLRDLQLLLRRKTFFAQSPLENPGVEKSMRDDVQRQYSAGGDPPWERSRPLGSKAPASPTLGGTSGPAARAWSRAGFTATPLVATLSTSDKIAVGHQHGATIRARRRLASGRLAMQVVLAAKGSPWPRGTGPPREATLLRGLRLPSRPARVTDRMLSAARESILRSWQAA